MSRPKKRKSGTLISLIAFLILTIPFTLIKIGNLIERLIKIGWKVIFFFVLLAGFWLRSGLSVVFSRQHNARRQKKRLSRMVLSLLAKVKRSLRNDLKALAKTIRWFVRWLIMFIPKKWRYFTAGVVFSVLCLFIPYQTYTFLKHLPHPGLLANRAVPVTTKIFDRNNQLLYEIYADQNRTPLPLTQIPAKVTQATIAIEDQEYYNHLGFSARGTLRAAWETLVNHNIQGGSTITQQLIKNALLTPEPTIWRKIEELILAFWAERLFSKDEILEMYLNQVPYGGTAWGIESAAQTYFGKSIKDVSLAEAALLASLPAAPTTYSPFGQFPALAKVRQKEVLRRMADMGFITPQEADKAAEEELVYARQNVAIKAPHFVMYVRDLLSRRYGLAMVEQGGLRVTTTLNLPTQEMVQDIVTNEAEKLATLQVGNGAAMVVNPKTGEILAMVGSKNYFDIDASGNVNVALALRQPGSSIKVVTYAAALERGFTPASVLDDSPVVYQSAGGPSYNPVNYDGRYHGLVSLRSALASSYNVPAVKVLARLGVQTMIDKGREMGIKNWSNSNRFGLSLTLGGGEVTMFDMMNVYATLANAGKRPELTAILKVTNYRGEELESYRNKPQLQVVSPEVAYILSDILADNAARTPAFGPNSALVVPGKTVSVKTGTSNEKRDNLTYGYTPSYVVGVWVGNNDNRPMHPTLTSGITGAAPIWQQIMIKLLSEKDDERPELPANIITLPCSGGRVEYFIRGSERAGGCSRIQPATAPTLQPKRR